MHPLGRSFRLGKTGSMNSIVHTGETVVQSIATFLLCLSCQTLLASEPLLEKTEVFPAGMNGVTLYRIPGIVVSMKGLFTVAVGMREGD